MDLRSFHEESSEDYPTLGETLPYRSASWKTPSPYFFQLWFSAILPPIQMSPPSSRWAALCLSLPFIHPCLDKGNDLHEDLVLNKDLSNAGIHISRVQSVEVRLNYGHLEQCRKYEYNFVLSMNSVCLWWWSLSYSALLSFETIALWEDSVTACMHCPESSTIEAPPPVVFFFSSRSVHHQLILCTIIDRKWSISNELSLSPGLT